LNGSFKVCRVFEFLANNIELRAKGPHDGNCSGDPECGTNYEKWRSCPTENKSCLGNNRHAEESEKYRESPW
jgi:hypothetical protein